MQKTEIHVKDRIEILEKSERYDYLTGAFGMEIACLQS